MIKYIILLKLKTPQKLVCSAFKVFDRNKTKERHIYYTQDFYFEKINLL